MFASHPREKPHTCPDFPAHTCRGPLGLGPRTIVNIIFYSLLWDLLRSSRGLLRARSAAVLWVWVWAGRSVSKRHRLDRWRWVRKSLHRVRVGQRSHLDLIYWLLLSHRTRSRLCASRTIHAILQRKRLNFDWLTPPLHCRPTVGRSMSAEIRVTCSWIQASQTAINYVYNYTMFI